MTLTLYITPLSPPSRSVLITAKALNIKLNLKYVDMKKGEHHSPDYLKINPLHTVPTLEDGTLVITDSHAINAYLVRKYGEDDSLYPKDFAKRALVDQRLHFDTGILFNLFRDTAAPLFYRKSKIIEQGQIDKVNEAYRYLEKFLEDSQWIATENVTIADFSLITTVTSLNILVPLKLSEFPKIITWIKNCEELSCVVANIEGLAELKQVIEICMR